FGDGHDEFAGLVVFLRHRQAGAAKQTDGVPVDPPLRHDHRQPMRFAHGASSSRLPNTISRSKVRPRYSQSPSAPEAASFSASSQSACPRSEAVTTVSPFSRSLDASASAS